MAAKALKAFVLLGLVAFAAAARVQGELAIPGQLQDAGVNDGELSHSGRSLKTFSLFGWFWQTKLNLICWKYKFLTSKFCAADKVFFDDSHYAKFWSWRFPTFEQQKCGIDRHEACGCYKDMCGHNNYLDGLSWERYWCPQTCGYRHYPADYFPPHICGNSKHLCNTHQGTCYHWNSLPFGYWCQASCGSLPWGKK